MEWLEDKALRSVASRFPLFLGLLAVYIPTFYFLSQDIWKTDEQGHGPIIFLISCYLFWQNRTRLLVCTEKDTSFWGYVFLIVGLLSYILGRSQGIIFFEVGSLFWVLMGVVLIEAGWKGLKVLWFPILFTLFMVPLPFSFVDAVTGPLKRHISEIAEALLYHFGYPVARQGVMISIGSYQLLVADACSGLHSMFSLSAIGFLYVYLMEYKNNKRNIFILMTILPIAFFANLCRVMVLILVTYYFGDDVAQGFIHGFAGIFLFIIALLALLFVDTVLEKTMFRSKQRGDV